MTELTITNGNQRNRRPGLGPDTSQRGTIFSRIWRLSVAAALLWGAGWLVWQQEAFRQGEAAIATQLFRPFMGTDVFQWGDEIVIHDAASHYLGLEITAECTTLVLIIPALILAAFVIAFLSVSFGRWALALVFSMGALYLVNMMRMGLIAFMDIVWGQSGFEWAHILIGTLFVLFGGAGVLIAASRIAVGRRVRLNSHRASRKE